MQGEGERATGTPNTIYDLSSVLFHALEGGASYDTFIEDAEREGDQELAEFFRQVRDEDSNRADRAQQLLAERTGGMATGAMGEPDDVTTMTGTSGVASRPEPSSARPLPDDVPPAETAGVERPESARPTREEVPPTVVEPPPGEGVTPGREDPLAREDPLDREERDLLGREDPGRREEREDALGRQDPLAREERASLGREDPARPEEERTRQTAGREEDKGLIDKALDKLSGREGEERRDR